jgi:exodeoxyribonuclease V alpha subunit
LLEIPEAILLEALQLELAEGALIADRLADRSCVFLAGLYQAERAIAQRLKAIEATPLPWARIDPEKALPWVEAKTGLTLAANRGCLKTPRHLRSTSHFEGCGRSRISNTEF